MTMLTRPLLTRQAQPHDVALADIGGSTQEVRDGAAVMGYIHQAGRVFVSLAGGDVHHAVEVGQSLSLARALEALGIRRAG
jgi:hypothetical protein